MSDSLIQIMEILNDVLSEELLAKNWQEMFDEPALVEPPMDTFAQQLFNIIKPESEPKEVLSSEDFEKLNAELKAGDDEIFNLAYEKVQKMADLLYQGLGQDDKMKKDLLDILSQQDQILFYLEDLGFETKKLFGLAPEEPQQEPLEVEPTIRKTITSPNIIKDAQSLAGVTKNVIGTTANNPQNLLKALKQISNFSNAVEKGRSLFDESGYNSKNASKVILLDYINAMIDSYSSGVAGYAFEYLMAGICGGRQMGISKTESGKMGAIDFQMQGGSQGSCKLYSNFANISQAVNGFKKEIPVFYTIGIRNKNSSGETFAIDLWTLIIEKKEEQMKTIDSAPEAAKIVNQLTDIGNPYSLLSRSGRKLTKAGKKVIGYYNFTMNGTPFPVLAFEGEPVNIPISKKPVERTGSEMFKFSFAKNDTTPFREELSNSFDQKSKTIIKVLSDIVDNITKTKTKTQEYFSSGNAQAGLDAFSAVYSTEENLKKLVTSVSGEEIGSAEDLKKIAGKS